MEKGQDSLAGFCVVPGKLVLHPIYHHHSNAQSQQEIQPIRVSQGDARSGIGYDQLTLCDVRFRHAAKTV